ncbi:hypothetical protein J5226_19525 [Lysobacter sp. K5869]|uniref:hypothetical protein n=1 Tax=Lysobacter sp. K5869 TaxID=2820808 RepID=UPI001C060714|nr:hypothetical protein [Lysobacter sp. K5869]QWP75778.1 hypothetical protein J5226_19525 [Lysobacter sp. K5869]
MGATAPAQAQLKTPTPDTQRQQAQQYQQERLQALTRRGRLDAYRQLIGVDKAAAANSAASRNAAIDLAALGFTPSEVNALRRHGTDLFDLVLRFFEGIDTSPSEQMLLADTVVVATAAQARTGQARLDGFLSEIPFTVVKSLKGTRAAGDVILVPRSSGPLGNGLERIDFSEIRFAPGKTYLLVLSKNWYEQYVALQKKQPESHFSALPYLAYEVSKTGALLPGPGPALSGIAPKDLKSIEADLNQSKAALQAGGAR